MHLYNGFTSINITHIQVITRSWRPSTSTPKHIKTLTEIHVERGNKKCHPGAYAVTQHAATGFGGVLMWNFAEVICISCLLRRHTPLTYVSRKIRITQVAGSSSGMREALAPHSSSSLARLPTTRAACRTLRQRYDEYLNTFSELHCI
jgi:hypothetical protein